MTDRLYKLAFARLRGIKLSMARMLLERCGSEEMFFTMTPAQISALMGTGAKIFADSHRREALEEARAEMPFIEANAVRMLYFTDPDYPRLLLECDDAPVVLFALGDLDLNAVNCLAIVGTRHATVYGNNMTPQIVGGIAEKTDSPVAIVSGLAFGIDVAAHRASLNAGLPTIAVVAHGLSTIYPSAHRGVAAEIIKKGGAILTEYFSSDPIHKGNFLARNRIVAGISQAAVIIESNIKGGAMFTARLASEYGRSVFALPGRVTDSFSSGCNKLISDNIAQLLTGADDIIDDLRWHRRPATPKQQELFEERDSDTQKIINLLTRKGELSIQEISLATDMPAPRLMAKLIDMEFDKLIASLPGSRYRLV